MAEDAGISVVVATRNRAWRLRDSLHSLAALHPPPVPWEIVVVDNGSTDGTAGVVREFARSVPVPVHALHEPRPGVSHARNTAVRFSSRALLAFADDDQDMHVGWLRAIVRAFDAHPDVDVLGGRVLPRWMAPPPPWFTDDLRGPVAIIDRGDRLFVVTRARWMCLPGGNMAWRRRALLGMGGFSTEYPRTQDRELTVRTLLRGGRAMYAPDAIVYHRLEGDRLTRQFFRDWYQTEGLMRAGYAFEELFAPDGYLRPIPDGTPRVLGVSRYLYRQWLGLLAHYIGARAGLRRADAFACELQLRKLTAYMRRRVALTAGPGASPLHRLCAVAAGLEGGRRRPSSSLIEAADGRSAGARAPCCHARDHYLRS